VILPTSQYENKFEYFIHKNHFLLTTNDTKQYFHSQIRKVTNNSKLSSPRLQMEILKLKTYNPSNKGLNKLHKPEQPVRTVVNWREAPAFKLARLFSQKIKLIVPLPKTHKLKNTTDLLKKLEKTPLLPTSN
jgi:hypothetical protein